MQINFKATKVFEETFQATKATNDDGSRKYSVIVQEGSSRSSKTWSNFQVLFNTMIQRPYTTVTVLRDTAVDCKDIVEGDWIKWLSDPNNRIKEYEKGLLSGQEMAELIAKEEFTQLFNRNKTKSIWEFKHNKSGIRFTGLDDIDKVMGMTQDICWINEPYKFSEDVFKQLKQRTGMFIICDWNPKQDHFLDKEKVNPTTITLKSTFLDNPFINPQTKRQLLSYQPISLSDAVESKKLTEEEAKAYDFEKNEKELTNRQIKELMRCILNEKHQTADKYHWLVFGKGLKAEKPNRIFKNWKHITYADYLAIEKPVWYGVDWGKVDPFAIIEAKYTDGRLYINELNYDSENTMLENMTHEQRFNINKEFDEGIVIHTFNRLNIDKSRPIICDSNRPDKVSAIYRIGYEYADTADKGPGSKLEGIDIMSKIEVHITHNSRNLNNEYEHYSYKLDRMGAVLEEPEDKNDHLMDAIRYIVLRLKRLGIIKVV